ncbi:MAG: 50S ribosomal protein L15 [Nitrososphaeria archaeon]|nr:50S ribosomal protein L15 [Nitrososphaeria archaeon]
MYKQIAQTWRKIYKENLEVLRMRAEKWRKEKAIVRIDKPTRLDRARRLGYKAKKGYIIVRVRLSRKGKRVERPRSGRRPKHMGVVKIKPNVNYKETAINRVREKYPNMGVLNAYYVYKDGKYIWYEVILKDKNVED